jgi:glycosyltransferase involved in cell wall biosynthesis
MRAQAGRDLLDIFHAQYIVPPFLQARTVNTIFDIAYEHLPELFPAYQRAWSKPLIRWSATRADHIITISEFSKRSIVNTYRIPEDRITVTYPAAGDEFRPMDKAAAKEEIAEKYGIRDNFILYLGRLQGRKNLPALIRAYARVRKSGIEHKLVLAGKPDSLFAPTIDCIRELGLQTEVLLPGYVGGEDVPKFYNAADVFVYPSVYEGFGLPVLEAMACGVPVITSRGSALEEIAGNAALLVDPPDDVAIANALESVLQNSELRRQLSDAGLKRSNQFSFAEMAKQTVGVYERVAGKESPGRSTACADLRKSGLRLSGDVMRIAIIGIKGIPARYGGFETAVDEMSREMVKRGHQITVYNRTGLNSYGGRDYQGVRLVTLPTIRTKNLSTICHSLVATLHATFTDADVVHYYTTGATLFAPLPRLFGKKIICSVDGTDWQRSKWGPFARWYLRLSEKLAVRFCHALVSDAREVGRYYRQQYGAESCCITYGIRKNHTAPDSKDNDVINRFGLEPRDYVLFVGRFVPENNIHHLIHAFERVQTTKRLVIVGDDPWEHKYVQELKSTRDPRILFTGAIYGSGYAQLQQNAYLFVLPDEVGGTHPALVEAMGFGNCVLVNDTPSNLEVIADSGFSYRGAEGPADLARKLQTLLDQPELVAQYRAKALRHSEIHYRWDDVVHKHEQLYRRTLDQRALANSSEAADTPDVAAD